MSQKRNHNIGKARAGIFAPEKYFSRHVLSKKIAQSLTKTEQKCVSYIYFDPILIPPSRSHPKAKLKMIKTLDERREFPRRI